jgi:hypothetical protein
MTKRFDVMSPRKRKDQEKTFWHRVGTAFEGEKGISITLDSLPLPDAEGRVSMFLFEPREKTESRPAPPAGAQRASVKDELSDEVPF